MRMGSTEMVSGLLVLLVVQSCRVCVSVGTSNFTDQLALVVFKSSITLDPNNVLGSNWTETTSFCNWVGVTCSPRRQRVTVLDLYNVGLHGTISPHVGNLSFLVKIDLGGNNFNGPIIHDLGRLRRLKELNLDFNHLEGLIPASLQHCQPLQIISIYSNRLVGSIPKELTTLPMLTELYLGRNNLTGTLPPAFANMSSLKLLGLEENKIQGNIPIELSRISTLEGINFAQNNFTGSIPSFLFNMSSMQQVRLELNSLSGKFPELGPGDGFWLSNLRVLSIGQNQFSGNIPLYLSNFSTLTYLLLDGNQFNGTVPTSLGQLHSLTGLSLDGNQLTTEPGHHELTFLTSVTSLSSLKDLYIDDNPFNGVIPDSIGNSSGSLQKLYASNCGLLGGIPDGIGSFTNLNYLILSNNNLSGAIPLSIGGMKGLQRLYLGDNKIEGSIPDEICHLQNLGDVNLQNNRLSGPIPGCIGNLTKLQMLFLSSNSLGSLIPQSLWSLDNLLFMNFSFNSLDGSLDPGARALKNLETIDFSWNQLSGNIPSTLGAFQSLSSLNLSRNSFWGTIPDSFGHLIALDFMDFSYNNLSGAIPKSLEALSHLKYLNLSYNKLSGEIPSEGPFAIFTAQSFMKNGALCGGRPVLQVPPCKTSQARHFPFKYVLPPIIASVVIFTALSLVVLFKKHRQNKAQTQRPPNALDAMEHRFCSYQELRHATNNFCEANLIGVGGFGSVYKGRLSDGTNIAVKILDLQLDGALKSFEAECRVLRTVRHRNLVKVITTCSNTELRALVLQYLPNGSLDRWLYSQSYCCSLLQRVSIMVDVALALEYLHHCQSEPVVHCDVKPSNVLLDESMVAHLGDFGIAKILAENKTGTQTKTLGTLGYIAPEYGSEGRVSTKGDIYSYGIMLLETITGKKPTEEMFAGESGLRQWVAASLPHDTMQIVDGGLLRAGEVETAGSEGIFTSIMKIGLECTREVPEERCDIKEVAARLNKIKLQLLHKY